MVSFVVALVCVVGSGSLQAQVLEIYNNNLFHQPSSDKGAHGAFDRITLHEIQNDPIDGDYLEFNHDITASSSSATYARMMFTSNGRLRRPSEFDSGLDMGDYNRLTFRARARNLPNGITHPVAFGMGLDTFGSQDTGSKSVSINLDNQWQTFNIDLVDLSPAGAGNLSSINCLFSLTFLLVHGSVVVDVDDVR